MRIRHRLFLKIYLTVLGSLAMVAVVLGVMAFLGKFDSDGPLSNRLERFAEVMFPLMDSEKDWQETAKRLAFAADGGVILFDRSGAVLAKAGDQIDVTIDTARTRALRHGYRQVAVDFMDGRKLVVVARLPFDPPRRNAILTIVLIAAAIGLAAYPVVRNLTRRLEGVRSGMEHWGDGKLDLRVPEAGSDEIADVARSFNRAADRIEALIRAQKNLLANASHELRSPLARLRMAIELYEDGGGDALKQEIIRNLAELDELVEEILLTSRLDGAARPDLSDQVDLSAIAAEEAALVGAEIAGPPIQIAGNAKLIRRLVRNLLQNAARHGAPPIHVTLDSIRGHALLSIRDHGEGLSESERERIFEPFYRPAGRSESAGGWGLGLALVQQIAQLHGGTVTWRQPDGRGAEFVVSLPQNQPMASQG